MSGLDARRAVQVVTSRTGELRFASGYIARTGLAITAQHAIADADAITVRIVDDHDEVRNVVCEVIWSDATVDLAVLRFSSGAADMHPVRFGRLAAPTPCEAVGYPLFKLRNAGGESAAEADVYRDSHHARGTGSPYGNRRSGTLELHVETQPPSSLHRDRSGWEGMSGAAVFAHDVLIGIITDNYPREGSGLLSVHPVERLADLPAERARELRELLGMPAYEQLAVVPDTVPLHRTLPRPPVVVGRDTELKRLTDAVESSRGGILAIHSLSGLGGVGKTAFAVHAAHHLAHHFPGGQLFLPLNAHTPDVDTPTPEEALARLLLDDGVRPDKLPDGLPGRESMWRERTAGRRMLLVLDDAANAEQVKPLIPAGREALVLITSRRRLPRLGGLRMTSLRLDVLKPADAAEMLADVVDRPGLDSDDEGLQRLAEWCGYLPLALDIVGAYLQNHPAMTPELLAREFRATGLLVGLERVGEPVNVLLDLSYRDLSDDAQRLFRLLGAHPGTEYESAAVAALLNTSDESLAGTLLADLESNRLLEETDGAAKRYRFHDLVREYAASRAAEAPDESTPALVRLLTYYASGWGPGASGYDSVTRERMLSWLRTERENLLECIEAAYSAGRGMEARELTHRVSHLLTMDGPRTLAARLNGWAVESAQAAGDLAAQARAVYDLGSSQSGLSAIDTLKSAASLFEGLGDRAGQARAMQDVAHGLWMHGDFAGAEELQQDVLMLFTELGDEDGQARTLVDRGELRRMIGEYEKALDDQLSALRLYRKLGIKHGQGRALIMLGEVRYLLGDYDGAAQNLAAALAIFETLGISGPRAEILVYRADVRAAQGDLVGGLEDIDAALSMFSEARSSSTLWAWPLGHKAALIAQSGDISEALDLYRQTTGLAREQRQPDDEAIALEGTGECLLALDSGTNVEEARAMLTAALRIYKRLGMRLDSDRVQARLDGLA